MTISDEQLSAFLDSELPAHEMELIRAQLCDDENLANRLAELAMVDEQVASHYATIDQRPMPDAVMRMLSDTPSASATVIAFPLRKKIHRALQQHAAMAASVALVIGFGAAQLLPGNAADNTSQWSAVAQVLNTHISGTETILDDHSKIKPRLSFMNQEGNYCRQFQITEHNRHTDSIACHVDNHWQLKISVYSQSVAQEDEYQTASGGSVLDSALDEMMYSDAFDAEAESQAIKSKWTPIQ